jgi:hypothetical protein
MEEFLNQFLALMDNIKLIKASWNLDFLFHPFLSGRLYLPENLQPKLLPYLANL